MGWKLVAYAAPLLIVVAGLIVLVTADGPAPQAADRSDAPFLGFPENLPGTTPGHVRVQVTVRCPAFGKSPAAAYWDECRLRQQSAIAQACLDPETETVDLLVLLVAPDGHTVNDVTDTVPCPVGALLVT